MAMEEVSAAMDLAERVNARIADSTHATAIAIGLLALIALAVAAALHCR